MLKRLVFAIIASAAIPPASGGSGVSSLTAVGSSPNADAGSISGTALTLQPADGTHPGVLVGSGAQTTGATLTVTNAITLSGGVASPLVHNSSGGNINEDFSAGGTQVILTQNNTTAYHFITQGGGQNPFAYDSTALASMNFKTNVGFVFPTKLSPSGTTQSVDWATGPSQIVDAANTTGTLTVSFAHTTNGGRYILETIGLTGRTWVFSGVKWAGGIAPTVTATTGALDCFQFICDGTNCFGSIVAQNAS